MNTTKISEMPELILRLNELPNHYIFRGHSSELWHLLSSIERMYPGQGADVVRRAEEYSIMEFKSKFHLYDSENRMPTTKLEWLSLMQHYGAPTRLLDFTTSPYVALYFAIETMLPLQEQDPCIYAIDYRDLIRTSIEALRSVDRDFNQSYEQVLKNQDEVFETVVDRISSDILWATEPSRVNLRLDRQAGCFLFSGRPGVTIETLLLSDRYSKVDCTKMVIDRKLYENIYALLTKANINSKVIYGDLSGLGKSIRMTLYAYK